VVNQVDGAGLYPPCPQPRSARTSQTQGYPSQPDALAAASSGDLSNGRFTTANRRYKRLMSDIGQTRSKRWRFLSNSAQVWLCIQRDPDARFRDIAQTVGITEGAAKRIVARLVDSGYVERERVGRRNRDRVDLDMWDSQSSPGLAENAEELRLLMHQNT
jgi:hypothetical protein